MSEQVNARRRNRAENSRTPLHEQRDNLNIQNRDPNYHYRYVNDVDQGQRILRFQKAGYEVVQDEVKVGDGSVEQDLNKTSTVTEKHVGGNMKAILMRIPKEWYEEDQAAKQKQVDAMEAAMRSDNLGKYGDVRGAKLDITRRK